MSINFSKFIRKQVKSSNTSLSRLVFDKFGTENLNAYSLVHLHKHQKEGFKLC